MKKTENRKSTRIRSRLTINYQVISADNNLSEAKPATTCDISTSGILFESTNIIPLDTELKISLNLPGINHPVIIISKVVRVEEKEFGKKYHIGVLFKEIKNDDRQEIIRKIELMDILKLLQITHQQHASDLHITYNQPPILRIHGSLKPLEMDPLDTYDLKNMIYSMLSDEQIARFEKWKELDFAFSPNPELRFRVNVHQQRNNVEATFRAIMPEIRSIRELGLPAVLVDMAKKKKGIIIIAGATGAGKTTTLSSIIDLINHERECVIISLEDPIEYIHTNVKSIVKQREIGTDTLSFSVALKKALRQDPDVIMVGELLDAETVRTAITAAETGHLVITSLHAPDTIQAIDRLINMVPPQEKLQFSFQLSNCVEGIITQQLLPRKDREGRVVATEVMVATDAVRNLIRDSNTMQITSVIQTGAKFKMHTMAESVKNLYENGLISKHIAIEHCRELEAVLS